MRIRNRKVPLPLSSLSPVPLSDLHFSLIQPNNGGPNCHNPSDYSFNQPLNKLVRKEGSDQYDNPNSGEDEEGGGGKSDDNGGKTMLGAKTVTSSFHQGDNVFPMKKRRESETKKRKSDGSKSGVNKRGRGGAVMEGSRCSRVNGRGWRCCQPTLVGYSLCEHHLGKGRLRSMANVPNESRPLSMVGEEELMVSKRKHKLGMVKARSMSSLLSQPNNATISIAENEE